MDSVINVAAGALVMFVFVWVLIFGGIGALLSNSRDGSSLAGMTWGAALGPIGWVAILWRTRTVDATDPLDPAPAGSSVHDY